jgi:hypothetical protein
MALFPLGILSAAGVSGEAPPAFELISTTILGSAASSVSFSSLGDYSSTYKHLQIRATLRGTSAITQNDPVYLRINGDSGTNYSQHGLFGNGSSVGSYGTSSTAQVEVGRMTAAGSPAVANSFSFLVLDILDAYSTTKNKTSRNLLGSTGNNSIILASGVWRNTNSITSISLTATTTTYVAGSRFSLYGIRG